MNQYNDNVMNIKILGFTICVIALIFSGAGSVYSQAAIKYHYARIFIRGSEDCRKLSGSGIDFEGSALRPGSVIESAVSDDEIRTLDRLDLSFEVLIDDLESYYANRLSAYTPGKKYTDEILSEKNYKPGSMGGFFTLEEIYGNFMKMKEKFPAYFAGCDTIGYTTEDRPLIAYTFGSPAGKESSQALYTALHHAREPAGVSVLIYFLWNLLEKADAGEPEALWLMNNRRIFVIPVVNPDGYYFNQTTNPGGGGMWRKNMRRTTDSTIGIDLNRNYGPMEYWDAPNMGSSVVPKETTYRGEAPFSEAETRAIRDFCTGKHIRTALNYHTYGNYLLYPNGSIGAETKDSALFRAMARELSHRIELAWGLDQQTVGYSARGNSDDWMYLATGSKPSIMAVTCEMGWVSGGFYPTPDTVLILARQNLDMNYQVLWNAGSNLRPAEVFSEFDTLTRKAYVYVNVRNTGVEASPGGSLLSISPAPGSGLTVTDPKRVLPPVESAGDRLEVFEVERPAMDFANGKFLPFEISITQDKVERKDTFNVQVYHYLTEDLFKGGSLTLWNTGQWGLESDSQTGEMVLSDSPDAVYLDSAANYLTLKNPVKIKNELAVALQFSSTWNIENRYDIGLIQVSTDNGQSWQTLRSELMRKASGEKKSPQSDTSLWGFSGFYPFWDRQQISLDKYKGKSILLRFAFLSDKMLHFDGWKLKDIGIKYYLNMDYLGVNDATAPGGIMLYPVPLGKGSNLRVFSGNSYSGQPAEITVYDISGKTVLISPVNGQTEETELRTGLLPAGAYYLEYKCGKNTETKSFVVQ